MNNPNIDPPTAVYLQDNFNDGFSDISETASYKTVDICEEEQLRRDLLKYPSLDPNDQELKFEKYNYYKSYKESRNIFPEHKILIFPENNSKKKVIYSLILVLVLAFTIIFYFFINPKLRSHSSQNSPILIGPHTTEYTQYWNIEGNSNSLFYNNQTFGSQIFRDPCVIISDLSLIKKIINSQISCTGKWCQSGEFLCQTSPDCYDLQYLIPLNGPEFQNSCKNITGNLVMSWKRWNQDIQKLIVDNYQNALTELNTILGLDTLILARSLIETCQINSRC